MLNKMFFTITSVFYVLRIGSYPILAKHFEKKSPETVIYVSGLSISAVPCHFTFGGCTAALPLILNGNTNIAIFFHI